MPSDHSKQPRAHIDIGGMALPRAELAEVLPDIQRFEQHLTDALAVDSYMKNGDGSIPGYAQQWPQERIAAVVATLNEIGSLREQLGEQMNQPQSATDPNNAPEPGTDRQ